MDDEEPAEEIAENLHQKGLKILDALKQEGGKANTRQITEATGIPSSNSNYWFKKLIGFGAIERLGTVSVGRGFDPNLYRITPKGEDILSAVIREDYDTMADGVERLRQDVRNVEGALSGFRRDHRHTREQMFDFMHAMAEMERRHVQVVNRQRQVIDLLLDEHPDIRQTVTDEIL